MNTKVMTATLALAGLALGVLGSTGCSANASPAPSETTSTSNESLDNGTGGPGYTCTEAGYCQCSGLADCDNMFGICKSHTYCNYDPIGGYRCCCLNYLQRTLPPPGPPGGGGVVIGPSQ